MAVTVNGMPVSEEMIAAEAARMRDRLHEAMRGEPQEVIARRLREWATENAIEKVLVQQAALADPEPIADELIEKAAGTLSDGNAEPRETTELRLRVQRLMERHAGRIGTPKMKEINEYYRKHRAQLLIPECVRVAHIVKLMNDATTEADALSAIKAAERDLIDGANFEELADLVSDDKAPGGSVGWIRAGQVPRELENAVFSLKPGGVSRVFRSGHGFHIFKVYEHEAERASTFDEAREMIGRTLAEEKQQKALERVVDYLKARALIERR